jgi:hypothetical protein
MDKYETKTVKALLKLLSDENPVPKAMVQARINLFIWAIIFIVVGFVLAENNRLSQGWGWLLFFAAGALGGAGMYQSVANKQWPILRKHLNKESMERSLSDSET